MKRLVGVLLVGLLAVAAVLGVRAWTLESHQLEPPERAIDVPEVRAEAAAQRLSRAVGHRTISHFDTGKFDAEAFRAFHAFLAREFPAAHAATRRARVAGYTLLYTWPGSEPGLEPVLLLAHQDVVPAPGAASWTHPPFAGEIADGFVWGRGTMDDKGNLMAQLEAVEILARRGFAPRRPVHLAFGHDEEVGGRGAQAVAALLAERGTRAHLVLDEGMAVVEGVVPGLEGPAALVGIAEKGYLSLALEVRQSGGHSSTPPPHTSVGILATAIHRLERQPLPARLDGVTRDFFAYLAPELPLGLRVAFANLWLFGPLVKRGLAAHPGSNAVMRTTTAATMLEGSPKDNVLPSRARAVVNFRILPGDTIEGVTGHVQRAIADPRVSVEPIGRPREASPVSDPEAPQFELLQRTIVEVFPEAVVAPGLVVGGTDARHYGALSGHVYRFSPYRFGSDDLGRVHGVDERIPVAGHADAVRFYVRFLQNAAG